MCKALKISRSVYYYKHKEKKVDTAFENAVIREFRKSRNNYGTRKLKIILSRNRMIASRRRIGNAMKKYELISNYTLKLYKKKKTVVNNDAIDNIVNRKFSGRKPFEVIVSDLTYVKVAGKWNYICILLDLANRKIIGSSVSKTKSAQIVKSAFYNIQGDIRNIKLFHTDRGSEFKNYIVEDILEAFNIKRSLSAKGSPIDNAVAESMYSVIKTEFAFNTEFESFEELELLWFDYVNWYNNERIHGSLNYKTPMDYCDYQPFPD